MFTRGTESRPGAKQFLVMVMDGRAVNNQEDLSKAVVPLENNNIKVITVVLPPNADEKQLGQIASHKDNVIKSDGKDTSSTLGDNIIDKVVKGESNPLLTCLFACLFVCSIHFIHYSIYSFTHLFVCPFVHSQVH